MKAPDADSSFLTRRRTLLIFSFILLLRVSIAGQFRGNFDSQSFLFAANAAVHGENVYTSTNRYNYSPLWAYVLGALWVVAEPNTGFFVLLVGLLQIGFDAGSALLVSRIAERRLALSPGRARRAALLFFSNPISVLVSGAQGQFDGTAVLCLLGAIYWAMDEDFARARHRVVGLLTLSLLVKHVTAFHPFLFWRRIRRPGLSDAGVTVPYVVFLVSFLPFVGAWRAIARNVFLYSAGVEKGAARPGGLQSYVGLSSATSAAFVVLFFLAVAWIVWITRSMALPRACLVLFLALLVFLPSYAPQYLAWPLALGALYASPLFGLYTALGALWHSSESLQLQWPVQIAPYAGWVAALLWLLAEIRRREDRPFGGAITSSA